MAILFFVLYLIFTLLVLYHSSRAIVWEIGSLIYLLVATFVIGLSIPWAIVLWSVVILMVLLIRLEPLRVSISNLLFERTKKSIPKLSKTEEEALNAGDTWLEQDIFTGAPNWQRLGEVFTELSEEEKSFLNNETQVLCGMLQEWDISQGHDLPEKVWKFIKEKGFFGLVIGKEYGGKGFSARAHSEVVLKIASRAGAAAVSVMVPNSLGPGELLHHYGTDKQKEYFLPRLAIGIEIPCFALTEPEAGSDATSLQSEAIVVKRKVEGKTILGLNVNLNKRWITLSPVATLIGLAVNLKDPDNLLKGIGKEGITCLLISRDIENLEIGNRHIPANQAFMNGTIRGENIFVPIDNIIGGQKMAGAGWQMLVECLSIGRSISLPSLGASSSSVAYVTTGAFARIRRQFNVEIRHFEGIEEKLAEIAGLNYMINATRLLTVAAVDHQKKPSVASAITKYFNTELSRIVINAAMDVHGGRGVVMGPRNYLANYYQGLPISITVEGANIMSRNLLIFGQGSMACHPFIRHEFYAVNNEDKTEFKNLLWKHIHYFLRNFARTFCSAWTGGLFISTPKTDLKREYQKLTRLSQAFSWLADLSLMYLGGTLKRKERLSARLADGMSYLYLAMASIRFYEQNKTEAFKVHAQWATDFAFYQAQKSLIALSHNYPSRLLGFSMRLIAFPLGQTMKYPSDRLDRRLSQIMTDNNEYRDFLLHSIYISGDKNEPVDRMEYALQLLINNKEIYSKMKAFGKIPTAQIKEKLSELSSSGKLTEEEAAIILEIEKARWDAILVDEFAFDDMKKAKFSSITNKIKTPFD